MILPYSSIHKGSRKKAVPAKPRKGGRKREPGVLIFGTGREVCQKNRAGRAEYARRKDEMYERQMGICSIGGEWMRREDATFEHEDLRGMGGGRRDDRIWIDGKPVNFVACGFHNGQKGSKRL